MVCAACKARELADRSQGDAPRCGFPGSDGTATFVADNWNCATLNALRALVDESQDPMPAGVSYYFCDNQKMATVYTHDIELDDEPLGMMLWMTWYKRRGTTEQVWILAEGRPPRLPTERELRAILAHYQQLR